MPHYEHVFMVRQDVSNAQVDTLTEQFKSVIEDNGGSIGKVEYWGVKSLAYRIKKNRKAHYTLMNITAPPPAVAEMERQMSLNEDVVRFLTLRMDELEEGPSAMTRTSRGRDERGGRDDRGGRDRDDRGGRDRDDRGGRDRDERPRREGRPPRAAEGEAEEAR